MELRVELLKPKDEVLAPLLSAWYQEEWQSMPSTTQRLLDLHPTEIVFHMVLFADGVPVAAGGLHLNVGLLRIAPEYGKYQPWVAMLRTVPEFRGQNLGTTLLRAIEAKSLELGYEQLYLYTHTAEKLYLREGWAPLPGEDAHVFYKGETAVVMHKKLQSA